MDGNFVPNIAFGPDQVKMLRSSTSMIFDVHMMVLDPERYVKGFAGAGADCITFHYEACRHLHRTIQLVKSFGKKVGVALNPATPVEELKHVLNLLDQVLIMTVNPGYGGQSTILEIEEKVRDLTKLKVKNDYKFEIQIDGGIGKHNIVEFIQAGATNIVIGSALFQKNKTEQNVHEFNEIISGV